MKKLSLSLSVFMWATALPAQTETKVDFAKEIRPILEQSCVECHGPKKQKGKLRLDSKEAAFKGGEDGPVIIPGKADKSDLYRRITLAAGSDDVMPNKGDLLTKAQTDLFHDWINQGAVWPEDAVVKAATGSPDPFARLVEIKPSAAEVAALKKLEAAGMPINLVAMNMNWHDANLGLHGSNVTDATLVLLKDVATLASLNLAGTKITDAGLANLKGLTNLLTMHLENTPVTDAGLAHLKGLINLTYLNLYGTTVSDAGLEHLKGLTNLQSLYLWQSKATAAGATNLQNTLPHLFVSRGWEPGPVAKKEEEKKPEEKK